MASWKHNVTGAKLLAYVECVGWKRNALTSCDPKSSSRCYIYQSDVIALQLFEEEMDHNVREMLA